MENKKSYYAIIPANVRYDKNLTANAKLLYGEITALCNEKGYCWANNSYFAELYGVSKTSISKWIKQLSDKGYVTSKIIYKEGTKEIEDRHIYIGTIPIEEKLNTPLTKVNEPIEEKLNTPIEEKLKDNNTIINNTINILLSLYEELGFGLINPISKADIEVMVKEYTAKWVEEAMKEANTSGIRNLKYVKGILKNWRTKGFKAERGGNNYGSTSKPTKNTESEGPKYNFNF